MKNPQANFVEQVHQTLGNMLHTKDFENYPFDPKDPWTNIFGFCAWAIQSTAHTLLHTSPAQLVFGRDMLFDLSYLVRWKDIQDKKVQSRQDNTERENSKRVKHTYNAGDNVYLNRDVLQRKLLPKRDGPFKILKVNTNGTVKICKGITSQTVSIIRILPCF